MKDIKIICSFCMGASLDAENSTGTEVKLEGASGTVIVTPNGSFYNEI